MLKKLLIASSLLLSAASLSAAELKIGVVDIQDVLSKAPQIKTMNDAIQAQFKDRYEELSALQKKGAELQEKLARDEMTMTAAQKFEASRQLKALDSDFKLKQAFLQEDIGMANKQEQLKIMKKIQDAVTKVAADGKFDLILKSEAALHVNSSIDISDKVLTIVSNPAG